MQRIGCSWLVWEWTHSAFWIGVLASADLLPVLIVSPFAGVAADRWDRLRLNTIAQLLASVNAVLIALLLAIGHLSLFGVVAMTAIQGILTAATQPSRLAMVQQMVSRDDVGTAVGLNSASVSLARLIGPALGGAIMLHADVIWVFVANAAVTVLFVLVLLRLKLMLRQSTDAPRSFYLEMIDGFIHVARTSSLRLILLTMVFGGMLVRATMELIPAFAAKTFEDVTGLAVLTGAAAIGALIAGLTIGRSTPSRLFYGVLLWWSLGGIAMVILAQAESQMIAIVASMVLGASVTRGQITTQTFVQLTTPDGLRGRALSLHGLVARGSPALGALLIGYLGDKFGLEHTVLYASCLLFALMLAMILPIRRAGRTVQDEF